MQEMMKLWSRGEEPKKGPQIDRQYSCGPQGRTSLYPEFNVEYKIERDFAAAKQEWDDARAKAAAAAAAAKK